MAVLQFIVNKKVWDGMSEGERTALEVWYSSAYDAMRREADLQDRAIAAEQKAGNDITVIDWAQEERDKFREIAVGAWQDFADKSPLAKEALDAHINYMRNIGLLKE